MVGALEGAVVLGGSPTTGDQVTKYGRTGRLLCWQSERRTEEFLRNRAVITVDSGAAMFDQIQRATERNVAVGSRAVDPIVHSLPGGC